jgi:hypothetical protein
MWNINNEKLVHIFNANIGIRSLANVFNQFVACGTQNGSLIFVSMNDLID